MTINFFKGHPSARLLPSAKISHGYSEVLSKSYEEYESSPANRHPLTYGTDEGNLDVRTTISKWIGSRYERTLDPDTINLTGGASYGVANILSACTHPNITRHAFIVGPTYFLINGAFIDASFGGKMSVVKETPGKEYDIDLIALEKQLIKHSLKPQTESLVEDPVRGPWKYYRYVMYLVPTFSNPGGLTYSIKTRQKLLQIARAYDMLLICDDVYDLLDYREKQITVPKIPHLDIDSDPSDYGNSISNCTFSKILAPGIRFGWQECPSKKLTWQIANTGANKSGGTPGQLASSVVAKLIEDGVQDEVIEELKGVYKRRFQVMKSAIEKYLPPGTQYSGGDGGYFLWVTVAGVDNHEEIVKSLVQKGVILASGSEFEVVDNNLGWGQKSVRLSASYLEEADIDQGIKIWGQEIERHIQATSDDPDLSRTARSSVSGSGDSVIMLTTEFNK